MSDQGSHWAYQAREPIGRMKRLVSWRFSITVPALAPVKLDCSPVSKVYLNIEKCYAFVEFNSIELTTALGQQLFVSVVPTITAPKPFLWAALGQHHLSTLAYWEVWEEVALVDLERFL
eukprot:gene23872-30149_t